MGPFITPFFQAIDIVLLLIEWTIIIWVILSWILFFGGQSKFRWRHAQFFSVLEQLNDIFSRMITPFLRPIRRMLRRFNTAGIDWSPLVLLLIIFIARRLLWALHGAILFR